MTKEIFNAFVATLTTLEKGVFSRILGDLKSNGWDMAFGDDVADTKSEIGALGSLCKKLAASNFPIKQEEAEVDGKNLCTVEFYFQDEDEKDWFHENRPDEWEL